MSSVLPVSAKTPLAIRYQQRLGISYVNCWKQLGHKSLRHIKIPSVGYEERRGKSVNFSHQLNCTMKLLTSPRRKPQQLLCEALKEQAVLYAGPQTKL